MKKNIILSTLLVIVFLIILVILMTHKPAQTAPVPPPTNVTTDTNTKEIVSIPTAGKFCFARNQEATTAAPYKVSEHVVLNFSGTKVTGTKSGTQAGPDMTNGYTGTLLGAVVNDEMELTYDYKVEGSENRELEVYGWAGDKLVKKRWALKDAKINGKSILVPDYVGDPTLIDYVKEECK